VLLRVALGDTNAEAARRLGVSRETVKRHLSAVYGKLGVTGRGKAAARLWGRGRP
jgi:DNA-binding CsgD family transcriptional regulator